MVYKRLAYVLPLLAIGAAVELLPGPDGRRRVQLIERAELLTGSTQASHGQRGCISARESERNADYRADRRNPLPVRLAHQKVQAWRATT